MSQLPLDLHTYVEVQPPDDFGRGVRGRRHLVSREIAIALKAILLAAGEQVSREKLSHFNVLSVEQMTLLSLAMAFRDDDSGIYGDIFEWSVLLGVNNGDGVVSQMIRDGLVLADVEASGDLRAVLVAAEGGKRCPILPSFPNGQHCIQAVGGGLRM